MAQISKTGIDSGSIIYPEHVLRPIEALRGDTGYDYTLSGSLIVSASDVKFKGLLNNPSPISIIAYNTASGDIYWTPNPNTITPASYVATGSVNGSVLTFTKGDNSTFNLTVSTTASSATSVVTASISSNTLTFTKGDSSTFDILLPTSSISSSFATTASYALNGGVTKIIAGTNVTISPTQGTGSVTINATGGTTGGALIYQLVLNMTGGGIDIGGTSIASVLGPNGENKATLEGLGWSFSTPTTSRLTIGRPVGTQIQPAVNIHTHGNNAGNVWTKSPSQNSTAGYAAAQTLSGGLFTTLDVYGITYVNTGCASSGATTVLVTFGIIS
jgi:hypothetical protein